MGALPVSGTPSPSTSNPFPTARTSAIRSTTCWRRPSRSPSAAKGPPGSGDSPSVDSMRPSPSRSRPRPGTRTDVAAPVALIHQQLALRSPAVTHDRDRDRRDPVAREPAGDQERAREHLAAVAVPEHRERPSLRRRPAGRHHDHEGHGAVDARRALGPEGRRLEDPALGREVPGRPVPADPDASDRVARQRLEGQHVVPEPVGRTVRGDGARRRRARRADLAAKHQARQQRLARTTRARRPRAPSSARERAAAGRGRPGPARGTRRRCRS